ncbi:MAG: hypothetical protein R6V47_02495 [Candidatus Delongbacteria bacterium]
MKNLVTIVVFMYISLNSVLAQPPNFNGGENCCEAGYGQEHMRMISEKRVKFIMSMLAEDFPEFYNILESLRNDHPGIFYKTIHKMTRFVKNTGKDIKSREQLIQIFKKEIEFDLLLEDYISEEDENKRAEIRSNMKDILLETFSKKEELKLKVLKKIEKNLELKKQEYKKRQLNKKRIIEEDLDNIIRRKKLIEDDPVQKKP